MKRYTRAALDGYGMLKLPKRIRKPTTSAPMGIGASAMLADEYLPTVYTNIPPDNSRGWRANNLALVGLGRNTRSRPRRPALPQPVVPQRTTSYRPLKFANPFYTTGAKKYAFPTFNSVMSSNGLTSVEQFQKQLRAARYKELLNSGFKMGDQFASIELHDDKNDELTFPMPHGVRNVESRDKNIDAMKKIEMQNAGIYDNKMRERVEMFKVFEEKRKKREREEYIQWLSEHYNEAYIPPDLAEEVKAKMESKQMGETDKKKDAAAKSAAEGVAKQEATQGQSKIVKEPLQRPVTGRLTAQQIRDLDNSIKGQMTDNLKGYVQQLYGVTPSTEQLKDYMPSLSTIVENYMSLTGAKDRDGSDDMIPNALLFGRASSLSVDADPYMVPVTKKAKTQNPTLIPDSRPIAGITDSSVRVRSYSTPPVPAFFPATAAAATAQLSRSDLQKLYLRQTGSPQQEQNQQNLAIQGKNNGVSATASSALSALGATVTAAANNGGVNAATVAGHTMTGLPFAANAQNSGHPPTNSSNITVQPVPIPAVSTTATSSSTQSSTDLALAMALDSTFYGVMNLSSTQREAVTTSVKDLMKGKTLTNTKIRTLYYLLNRPITYKQVDNVSLKARRDFVMNYLFSKVPKRS